MKFNSEKIKNYIYEHRLVFLYAVLAVVMESISIFVVEDVFTQSKPFISIGILLVVVGIALMVKGDGTRLLVCSVFLAVQLVLDLLLILIYEMNGQYFYYEMLNLRNDAVATIENFPVNFLAFYAGVILCVIYVVYGLRMLAKNSEKPKKQEGKNTIWYQALLCLVGICTVGGSIASYYPRSIEDRYKQLIDGKTHDMYASYGLIGNLIGEFGSKIWEKKVVPDDETIETFLYAEDKISAPTNYFGTSKGKNVVVILAESLEWFAFLNDERFEEKFPNALPFTDEELASLYPNLTKFYQESVVAENYHSREKTDASETLSILGSYPLDGYVTYDYPEVVMPSSLPNILDLTEGEMQKRSFHNGDKEFYNRIKTHISFGFDTELTDKLDMEKYADAQAELTGEKPTFTNYADMEKEEYNLDSEMFLTCKDWMFPTSERFFTFITTITTHGTYVERDNLKKYNERIVETLGERMPKLGEDDKMTLLHYMTAAMDLDAAIGIMMDDLKTKGLLDDTLILLFGDHNAYYNSLSNYVKDIDDYQTERKYTDLYNVPLMIYDADLIKNIPTEKRVVSKFACTADIVPTLLDLLGIKYYGNMYYGHSIFSTKQSVLYSRGYGIFVGDGIVGNSVKDIVYRDVAVTKGGEDEFIAEATNLVEKMKYCDYIFIKNWYKTPARLEKFQNKIRLLNDVG